MWTESAGGSTNGSIRHTDFHLKIRVLSSIQQVGHSVQKTIQHKSIQWNSLDLCLYSSDYSNSVGKCYCSWFIKFQCEDKEREIKYADGWWFLSFYLSDNVQCIQTVFTALHIFHICHVKALFHNGLHLFSPKKSAHSILHGVKYFCLKFLKIYKEIKTKI